MSYKNTRIYILEIINVKIVPRFIVTKFTKAAFATPSMITAQFALVANHLTIVTLNGLLEEAIYCQVIGLTTLFTVVLFMWFGLIIRSAKRKALSVIFSILMADLCFLASSAPKGSTCKWTLFIFSVSGAISWFVSSSPSGEHRVSICTLPLNSSGEVSVALGALAWTRSGTRVWARAGLWGQSVWDEGWSRSQTLLI